MGRRAGASLWPTLFPIALTKKSEIHHAFVGLDGVLEPSTGTPGLLSRVFFGFEKTNAAILSEACDTESVVIRIVKKYWTPLMMAASLQLYILI